MSAQSDVQKSLPGRLPPDVGWLDPTRNGRSTQRGPGGGY
jgi:hypothetical protein